jgi:hypothetical protein
MSSKLSKEQIIPLLADLFTDSEIENQTLNRFWTIGPPRKSLMYVSQCKPSTSSRGNWKYEFFHTIKLSTVLEVLETHGKILLIDYIRKRYCLLGAADIGWIIRFSSRNKSNEGQVIDVVIKEKLEQVYVLRPMDTHKKEERIVKVVSFK